MEEAQEKVGTALYELGLLHKIIKPTPNSYIDRHFNTVKELLHEGLSALESGASKSVMTKPANPPRIPTKPGVSGTPKLR